MSIGCDALYLDISRIPILAKDVCTRNMHNKLLHLSFCREMSDVLFKAVLLNRHDVNGLSSIADSWSDDQGLNRIPRQYFTWAFRPPNSWDAWDNHLRTR